MPFSWIVKNGERPSECGFFEVLNAWIGYASQIAIIKDS